MPYIKKVNKQTNMEIKKNSKYVRMIMILLSFIVFHFSLVSVSAQTPVRQITIKEVFKAMPDSLIPYLSQNNRLDFIDFMESNMEAKVTNSLNGISRMDIMNDQFLSLTLNEASKVQIRLLPVSEPVDSMQQIICLVHTLGVKGLESTVSFYSCSWRPLQLSINGIVTPNEVLVQPTSMPDDRFQELKTMLMPYMFWASLSEAEDVLTIGLSEANISTDDKEDMKLILRLIKLKWNGVIFNKI